METLLILILTVIVLALPTYFYARLMRRWGLPPERPFEGEMRYMRGMGQYYYRSISERRPGEAEKHKPRIEMSYDFPTPRDSRIAWVDMSRFDHLQAHERPLSLSDLLDETPEHHKGNGHV